MEVTVTDRAIEVITESAVLSKGQVLLIQYETDGCGCVVNGVSQLTEVKEEDLTNEQKLINTKPASLSVAIDKRVEWIYDEKLMIDFSDDANMFQLKSPNEMLNPRMSFRPS